MIEYHVVQVYENYINIYITVWYRVQQFSLNNFIF